MTLAQARPKRKSPRRYARFLRVAEHWRVAFRRRYFTSRRQLQDWLDGFLRFYNFKRTHYGYRLNGRRPGSALPRRGGGTLMPASRKRKCQQPFDTGQSRGGTAA